MVMELCMSLTMVNLILTAPTFLSGMILTNIRDHWSCPVVTNICRRTSSVTLGSSPPTYKARLLGSGAARRANPPALPGDKTPPFSLPDIGDVMAVGIGLVFWGMITGGSGGGGI